MPVWGKLILDYLWGKIVPLVAGLLSKLIKTKKINSEVDSEEEEIEKIRQEINEYLKRTGEDEVPKHLEDKLRSALRKRNRGL